MTNSQPQNTPDLSAEETAKLNAMLWPIDTDEWIEEWVEDIDDDAIDQLKNILFPEDVYWVDED